MDGDSLLSNTVRKLVHPNGCTVYLIGTAHFSTESQKDVENVISATKPGVVLIELDKARLPGLLQDPEDFKKEATNLKLSDLPKFIKKYGTAYGVFYYFMLYLSSNVSSQLEMTSGSELRTAITEAKKLPNCRLILADRPINVTFARTIYRMGWYTRARLLFSLLATDCDISKEDVEKFKDMDMIEKLIKESGCQELIDVIIYERDAYLAYMIWTTAQKFPDGTAVAVVGFGHLKGITKHIEDDAIDKIDFQDISSIPQQTRLERYTSTAVKYTFISTMFLGTGFLTYKSVKLCGKLGLTAWKYALASR